MLNVLLYTTQPILALGLTEAFAEGDCRLASICSTTPLLLEALTRERFGVLLIEVTPEISAELLSEIKDAAQGTPIVIWVDAVSTEFVGQAIGLGVRGVLRTNLSLELQVRCLDRFLGHGDGSFQGGKASWLNLYPQPAGPGRQSGLPGFLQALDIDSRLRPLRIAG